MTVWVPPTPRDAGFSRKSNARAIAKGLTFRPLAVTAKDTLDWNKTRPADQLQRLAEGAVGGISPEREAQVLAAWKAKQSTSR
jgi:2'-hydroxyisoflavone reductase